MKYKPQNKEQLQKLVDDESIYLGDIDTSLITDMSYLFANSKREDFSGIEKWDVSGVEDMYGMFSGAEKFNQPLDSWDVSNVRDMGGMFREARSFNQPLDSWDVSRVREMSWMFREARSFNQPLDSWDVSSVRHMRYMFSCARSFNQDISNWDVRAEYKNNVFYECAIDEKFKPKCLQNNQRKHNRGRGR